MYEDQNKMKQKSESKPKTKNAEVIKDIKSIDDINNNVKTNQDNDESSKEEKKIKDKPLSLIEALQQKKTINSIEEVVEEPVEDLTDKKSKRKRKENQEKVVEEVKYPRYYNTPILEGLSNEIVEERKAANLVNVGTEDKGKTVLEIILSNFFTFFNMLYFTITIIFVVLGSFENLLFLGTIIPNLVIGIFQEIKAKKTMDKLSLMSSPTTTVVRNGEKIEIPVSEVVLDDIIFYTPGKQICADSVVVEGFIEVNESLLTGESDAIVKNVGDQLLSGSFVVSGVAVARVDKVGKDNYIEKLSNVAKVYQRPRSELLRTLNGIIKIVSGIIIPLAVFTYLTSTPDITKDFLGILNKEGLIKASSSILAMIPAGLFLLTTMALAVSVRKLGKSKTLVQELYCIEMLARVNVLCLDKTGTITDGSMRVCDCIEIKNHTDYTMREIVGSMMNAFQDSNPTSEALIKYFDKNNVLVPTEKIPFSSKRKYSAVTFGTQGTFILGAPEFVLVDNYDKVAAKVERFSAEGNRVLVLGHVSNRFDPDNLPKNVKPLCLIILQDHIREDAADTIDYFKQNGVDVKVISGDNPITVSEIALRAGIEGAERYISLAGLTDDEVRESVFDYTVFGRVTPNQKKILVQTLKEHKKTVAMTGDGVNDILALKEADCSIAMASGSEAARYVSHLVLMDSNFASMPKVVQEGRRVINNIQRTSTLFLVKTMFAILLAVMYIILGIQNGPIRMSYPFDAKNLYMIEWFAIGIPAFFLALQPNTDIVKGKFLSNVIKSTLPGALTVIVLHLLLNFLRVVPGFEAFRDNKEAFTTIATIVTTTIMMFVLFQVSHPFNWVRKTVYVVMVIACFVAGFDLIPIMKLDLSFRRSVDEYKIELTVNENNYWNLDGHFTPVRAIKEPIIINLNEDKYLTPVITINKDYKWRLNGINTNVSVDNSDTIELKVVDKYWYLNDVPTQAKAVIQPELIVDTDKYIQPALTINKEGEWCLDGETTEIIANDEKTLILTVNYSGYWYLNGRETPIKAEEKVIIYNPDEYVLPTVTIVTMYEERYFAINNITTNILANDGDQVNLLVNDDGYWTINDAVTPLRASKITDSVVEEVDYVSPTLEISGRGVWIINGISTNIKAENNILITEILITLLFVQLVYPLMYLISSLLKKLRITSY